MIWNLAVAPKKQDRRVRKQNKNPKHQEEKKTKCHVLEDREAEMLLMHAAENLETHRNNNKQLASSPSSSEEIS